MATEHVIDVHVSICITSTQQQKKKKEKKTILIAGAVFVHCGVLSAKGPQCFSDWILENPHMNEIAMISSSMQGMSVHDSPL